jgi:arabinose-5-phosphate isomerase
MTAFIDSARRTLAIERDAIAALQFDPTFTHACELLLACQARQGRVVVTGMGKSGHIGGKIAATLASTGTPAFFVHPGEASHGDLGMITRQDVVLALSNSGETHEVLALLPLLKRAGIPLVSITGKASSTLARAADAHLNVAVAQEACPHNLAPTASTTAALVMGDALAVALLEARGFTPEQFAMSHPGGALGKRLLLTVADLMQPAPQVPLAASLPEALLEMTDKGLGMTAVVDDQGRALGIFTDGDLRRAFETGQDIRTLKLAEVFHAPAKRIPPEALAAEAVRMMEQHRIQALLVVNESGQLVGALNMHALLRAGVV